MGECFFANLVGSIRQSKVVLNWANFLREPSWRSSSKLYSGPKSFAQHVLGTFALLDDHCLWLAESRALLWMKKRKRKKWMTVSLGSSLASEGICLFVDLRSLVSKTQNEIVVSWITQWGVMKVYWLDFSLHCGSCCLLRVCRKFGPKLASHYKPVENEVKFGLSEPCSAN